MSDGHGPRARSCCCRPGARWLSCTDADSRVPEDWLVAQLALGADAVCGTVTVDRWSEGFEPQARIRYHDAYQDSDGHRHIHGANLGISAAAYVRAGGFEALACHEDVQLVRQLQRSRRTQSLEPASASDYQRAPGFAGQRWVRRLPQAPERTLRRAVKYSMALVSAPPRWENCRLPCDGLGNQQISLGWHCVESSRLCMITPESRCSKGMGHRYFTLRQVPRNQRACKPRVATERRFNRYCRGPENRDVTPHESHTRNRQQLAQPSLEQCPQPGRGAGHQSGQPGSGRLPGSDSRPSPR